MESILIAGHDWDAAEADELSGKTEGRPDASIDCQSAEGSDAAIRKRLSPARGAMTGVILGAALWAAIISLALRL